MSDVSIPAPRDRPREKLERCGVSALGDNELLAAVLGHGTAQAGAAAIADTILRAAGGVHRLTRLSRDDLRQIPGLGDALTARVLAAIELGRRTLLPAPEERPQFVNPLETARFLLPQYGAFPVERFGVLLLDTKHRLLGTRLLTVGSLNASVVHPREVFRPAIASGAAVVILFHNHPSGDPTPSTDDIVLTSRMMAAGALIGIAVADHVVLADARYVSFKESRVLQFR